VEPVLEPAA